MSKRTRLSQNIGALVSQPRTDEYLDRALTQPASGGSVQSLPPDQLRPSPFQPIGRPSTATVEAVEQAIRAAGSLAALTEDAEAYRTLDEDAQELAQLAADVALYGVTEPVEARETDPDAQGRTLELLAGHRRRAAALLVQTTEPGNQHARTIPVRSVGRLSDPEAAERVFRANRLRRDFSAWQEAVSLDRLRRAIGEREGKEPSLRDLARRMGYALGRASELQTFAQAFPPDVLTTLGEGDATKAGEALARLSYKTLRGLMARRKHPASLLVAARRATGLESPAPDLAPDFPTGADLAPQYVVRTPERDDHARRGFTLTVIRPIAQLEREDATRLLTILTDDARRVRARLKELDHDRTRQKRRPAPTKHKATPRGRSTAAGRREGRSTRRSQRG